MSGLAEKMFKQLESTNERFEVKIMMMSFVSRLVGIHQVSVCNVSIVNYLVPNVRPP